MTTATAAVLYQVKQPLVVEEVELLDPRPGEVQVRWVANGVCHSDYHLVSCGVLAGAGPVFNRAKVPVGATVAVYGCGGVGLNTIQMARLVGAAKIIAVDVVGKKLDWATEFGATHVVDASREDPVARVQALAGGGGGGYGVEAVGLQRTIG